MAESIVVIFEGAWPFSNGPVHGFTKPVWWARPVNAHKHGRPLYLLNFLPEYGIPILIVPGEGHYLQKVVYERGSTQELYVKYED